MPAGFSALDFYFILPEILLTCGALVLLMLSVIVPKRDGVLLGVALTTIAVTLLAVLSFAGLDETISRGLLAIDGFATFFKSSCCCRRRSRC